MDITAEDRNWIEQAALAAGFDLAGIAAVPEPSSEAASAFDRRYAEWIAGGRAGDMDYLKRSDDSGGLLRGDLRRSIPWARSVVVCAVNYNTSNGDAPLSIDAAEGTAGWIARYAWSGREPSTSTAEPTPGSDYHDVLLPRLRLIEAQLHERFACETRCYVDTGPIVERDYAARAGIGWIGKNTCVLNQQQGSWLLLGVIVTSLELAGDAWSVPAADRCGSCTRCIDACPTHALTAPRQMDASLCIAYLTIEKKGSIAEELRPLMGRQVFGCDICQDVCPWNGKSRAIAPANSMKENPLPARVQLINPQLDWLASLDGSAFNRWFRGSPLERTRRKRLLRNVAIAMGNSGEQRFLPQLDEWSQGEDPVLAEAARWAGEHLRTAFTRDK
ncbi:MAG: tRNA epoxyqueuosine(34) reductase QueG [Acidobacteriota bacterium]